MPDGYIADAASASPQQRISRPICPPNPAEAGLYDSYPAEAGLYDSYPAEAGLYLNQPLSAPICDSSVSPTFSGVTET